MDRLTNKHEADAQRKDYENRIRNGYPRNVPEERFLRLAAYEDTHMMPSDVTSMRMDMAILTALFDGIDVDRMRELVSAEKDGRVVVLPCKVGDTVYRVFNPPDREPVISAHTLMSADYIVRWLDKFGKSVFLTREEAERAMRKEDDDD